MPYFSSGIIFAFKGGVFFSVLSRPDKHQAEQGQAGAGIGEWRPQGRSFCFCSANVCLLPDSLARFNNLSDTHRRAREVGKRIRNGASRPQIKIYIDSPTNTSIRYGEINPNFPLHLSAVNASMFILFLLCLSVRRPSAALPQVSVVPHRWTNVQTKHTQPMAQPTPKLNLPPSARFTPQVPLTAPFTPLWMSRALLNALCTLMGQTLQQNALSTKGRLKAAQTVPFTPQGRLQTAPCIPQ